MSFDLNDSSNNRGDTDNATKMTYIVELTPMQKHIVAPAPTVFSNEMGAELPYYKVPVRFHNELKSNFLTKQKQRVL